MKRFFLSGVGEFALIWLINRGRGSRCIARFRCIRIISFSSQFKGVVAVLSCFSSCRVSKLIVLVFAKQVTSGASVSVATRWSFCRIEISSSRIFC